MKGKYTYRIINTVITAIGTLLCIVSGFIPAPYGLLSDGTISLIQSLPGSQKAVSFLLPVLLFIAATVIVGAGRYRLGSLITVLAGSCIFALMDLSYIKASMAFTGTLLNELGIVTALSGVLLHAVGTPPCESHGDESMVKTLDPFLEVEPVKEPKPEAKPEPETEAAESVVRTGLPEEIGNTDEQQENNAPSEITPAADPMTYTQVLQPCGPEFEELIPEDSEKTEEVTIEAAPEAEPLENTIVLEADFEDLLINADREEN